MDGKASSIARNKEYPSKGQEKKSFEAYKE